MWGSRNANSSGRRSRVEKSARKGLGLPAKPVVNVGNATDQIWEYGPTVSFIQAGAVSAAARQVDLRIVAPDSI